MKCPQCSNRVPSKILWTIHGGQALACPHCKVSLCPRAGHAVALFLLACLAGDVTLIFLRRSGAESWMAVAAFIVVFAAAYLVGMRFILRMRVKNDTAVMSRGRPQTHLGGKA